MNSSCIVHQIVFNEYIQNAAFSFDYTFRLELNEIIAELLSSVGIRFFCFKYEKKTHWNAFFGEVSFKFLNKHP